MIKNTRPPNFEEIRAAFPLAANKGVIFAYAPDIYVPDGTELPASLVAHEEVHIARQQDLGVDEWWKRYLIDVKFRFEEELLAHRAEYQFLAAQAESRPVRRQMLKLVAKKLAAPLYGNLISVEKAMQELRA